MPPLRVSRRRFLAGSVALVAAPAGAGATMKGRLPVADPRLVVIVAHDGGGFETGSAPASASGGWLNRLAAAPVAQGWRGRLLAVGPRMPAILGGPIPASLCCARSLRLAEPARLAGLLADPEARGVALRLSAAPPAAASAADAVDRCRDHLQTARALGRLLAEPDGPRIAVLPADGACEETLAALRDGLGGIWRQTVVLAPAAGQIASGGEPWLLGGAAALRRPSDSRPTLARVLADHLGVPEAEARSLARSALDAASA